MAGRWPACFSLTPRPYGCAQARDLGCPSAAVLAQLGAAPLLRRLDLMSDQVLSVRGSLAPRADAASGAGSTRHGVLGFLDLPRALAMHVFSFVPADARARAALVCRAWRDVIADASLWTVLDLSPTSGVAQPVADATLRGAAALARGGLTVLCLDDCVELSEEARLEVVTANAGSLRELSCVSVADISGATVLELACAAPQLMAFNVDVYDASVAEATRMLRNEAPFGAVQLCRLCTEGPDTDEGEAPLNEPELLAFCSAVAAHGSLEVLEINDTPLNSPAVMDALSASALASKLLDLEVHGCALSPASVPALARLIRDMLKSFRIQNGRNALLDEATAVQLADAVAASHSLILLRLSGTRFWDNAPAAAAVMRALTGHPCLHVVDLSGNNPPDQLAAGTALGALVAANTPALNSLTLCSSNLGDAGLAPLFDALPHNNHIRMLSCWRSGMTEALACDVVLPAVRANTSLRLLQAGFYWAQCILVKGRLSCWRRRRWWRRATTIAMTTHERTLRTDTHIVLSILPAALAAG